MSNIVTTEQIERQILLYRGQKVLLDVHLAALYGVTTKRLNEQVKRNRSRFPDDFTFQLTPDEVDTLRSQIATSKGGRGGRRYAPYVFTEQGVAMLSTVLNSERAIQVNIEIMRAFVRLRQLLASNDRLARKLEALVWSGKRSIGEEIRRTIQGGLRCHPPIDDPARAQEAQDRLPGRGTRRALRKTKTGVHFRYRR